MRRGLWSLRQMVASEDRSIVIAQIASFASGAAGGAWFVSQMPTSFSPFSPISPPRRERRERPPFPCGRGAIWASRQSKTLGRGGSFRYPELNHPLTRAAQTERAQRARAGFEAAAARNRTSRERRSALYPATDRRPPRCKSFGGTGLYEKTPRGLSLGVSH